MHWEVEQKFRVDDLPAIRRRLLELGVQFHERVEQVDQYFQHPARDFGKTDEALRLRQIGERNFITYKGPKIDAATKTRRELELPLPSGSAVHSQFASLLTTLGFVPAGVVKKQRELGHLAWNSCNVEIALDNVEGLGTFVEIEIGATDDKLQQAKDALAALQTRLGLTDPVRRSYLELLMNNGP